MRIDPSIIINTLNKNEGKVRLTARKLGISPATVINWRRKAKPLKRCIRYTLKPILKRKSTQPKKKRITTLSQEQRHDILSLKNQYGYGASKIKCLAQITQSSRCIHRYLKSKDLVVEGKNYRRPRYQQTTHMYLKNVHKPGKLQLDVKYVTPELSGLVHTTYLYATIDIYSRYKSGVILLGNYIKKLNVSLHSLDQEVYSAITHGEKYSLHKVIYGIQLFREKYPHVPVVLNVALVEGVNSELKQIKALVNLATQIGADIKFIELYPKGVDGFIPLPVLSENLNKIGFSKVLSTFRKMSFTNGEVQVALTQIFCSFAENEKDPSRFCQENNDLFVTPEGKIKPCRHSMIEFDLKKHLTDDANLDGIKLVLDDAIRHLGARCILGK